MLIALFRLFEILFGSLERMEYYEFWTITAVKESAGWWVNQLKERVRLTFKYSIVINLSRSAIFFYPSPSFSTTHYSYIDCTDLTLWSPTTMVGDTHSFVENVFLFNNLTCSNLRVENNVQYQYTGYYWMTRCKFSFDLIAFSFHRFIKQLSNFPINKGCRW